MSFFIAQDSIGNRFAAPFEYAGAHRIPWKKSPGKKLHSLPDGITEFVFHPATDGFSEMERAWRTGDLALLDDADVRAALEGAGTHGGGVHRRGG